jgi:DNA topoisomerase-1
VAQAGALRYGSDQGPGIRRLGHSRFKYVDDTTHAEPSSRHLERIRALAIPPAWTNVWIARDPRSHLQATGRDARGRKQYRYHPDFIATSAEHKFGELAGFGGALGSLRRRVRRDLARDGLEHDRVVAVVVRLLDVTSMRVGNEAYASENNSFGLTTLREQHVAVRGTSVRMMFPGKSGHDFDISLEDKTLARIVRTCQHLPGQKLFRYERANGLLADVTSNDVNRYLAEHGAVGTTAKTFRTWNATVRAASRLASVDDSPTARALNAVIDTVAADLGNTRSVCRASYIHPVVVDRFLDGSLPKRWNRTIGQRPTGLNADERRTLRLLRTA